MSPFTSKLYPGVAVPAPILPVVVSTNRLAVPTSKLEDAYTLPSTWSVASGWDVPIPILDV